MKILPPVSIEARRLLPSRWDLLAAALVLGFHRRFCRCQPLPGAASVERRGDDLSLDPALLPGYALRTAPSHAAGDGRCRWLFTFTYATWAAKNPARRHLAGAAAGHPAIGADPGLPVGDGGLVPVAVAGAGLRRRTGLRLRHLHQPGLEHGLQLLPVAAHRARGPDRGRPHVRAVGLGALLAHRGALRHAAA